MVHTQKESVLYVPNLKWIAPFIQKLLGGSQNLEYILVLQKFI